MRSFTDADYCSPDQSVSNVAERKRDLIDKMSPHFDPDGGKAAADWTALYWPILYNNEKLFHTLAVSGLCGKPGEFKTRGDGTLFDVAIDYGRPNFMDILVNEYNLDPRANRVLHITKSKIPAPPPFRCTTYLDTQVAQVDKYNFDFPGEVDWISEIKVDWTDLFDFRTLQEIKDESFAITKWYLEKGNKPTPCSLANPDGRVIQALINAGVNVNARFDFNYADDYTPL